MAERLCPICKRPLPEGEAAMPHPPFCSKRCADVDLGRWLTGSYAVPAVETDEDDGIGEGPEDTDKSRPPH